MSLSASLAEAAAPFTSTAERSHGVRRRASEITIEIAAGAQLAEIQAEWSDLCGRADVPNVFMHPRLIAVGARYPNSGSVTLLAWRDDGGRRQLVGLWAFGVGRAPRSIIPVSVLIAAPFPHSYLAAPVIDRDVLDKTLAAMLDKIAGDRSLPKIIALDGMRTDCATSEALMRILEARGSRPYTLRRFSRPMLASTSDGKAYLEQALSAERRKKMRKRRRKLAEMGTLDFKTITNPAEVGSAVDDFLSLEAAGWKGRARSALMSCPLDAVFAREMVVSLAERGDAWIYALTLGGRSVAMQIMLRTGNNAYSWKTAYDETLGEYAPGVLLLEDYTVALLADPNIAIVDSCAFDDTGIMATWRERQPMTELWLDARPGGSAAFAVLSRLQDAYASLRTQVKTLYRAFVPRPA